MTSNQIIESLKEVIVSLKAQLEVYRLEREQDKRQINALMSIITGLRKEISSLREAIDGRNEDLVQIPFDMRSVIPAICGHSFFKYFYGCKVNVLIRHLGQ